MVFHNYVTGSDKPWVSFVARFRDPKALENDNAWSYMSAWKNSLQLYGMHPPYPCCLPNQYLLVA